MRIASPGSGDGPASSRRILGRVTATAVVGVTLAAFAFVVTTPYNQCDNMAGTCIRTRQIDAILLVQWLCGASVVIALALGLLTVRAGGWRRWHVIVLGVCGLFAIAVLVTDPVAHFNNRFIGWLGDGN